MAGGAIESTAAPAALVGSSSSSESEKSKAARLESRD